MGAQPIRPRPTTLDAAAWLRYALESTKTEDCAAAIGALTAVGTERARAALLRVYAAWAAAAGPRELRSRILDYFGTLPDRTEAEQLLREAIAHELPTPDGIVLGNAVGVHLMQRWKEPPDLSGSKLHGLALEQNPRVQLGLLMGLMFTRPEGLPQVLWDVYHQTSDPIMRSNLVTNLPLLDDPALTLRLADEVLIAPVPRDPALDNFTVLLRQLPQAAERFPDYGPQLAELVLQTATRSDIDLHTLAQALDALGRMDPVRLMAIEPYITLQGPGVKASLSAAIERYRKAAAPK